MYSRNYANEIGMNTAVKIIPLTVAIPVLGTLVAGAWIGLVQASIDARSAQSPDKITFAAPPPSETVANR